ENAANNAGGQARIRIIDVDDDDDYVLAELVTAGSGAAKRRRSRGRGRGRADLTSAEETKQLRQLAEEAAHQAGARPPIGISAVTEEEERQDKAAMAERRSAETPAPHAPAVHSDQAPGAQSETPDGEGDGRRRRRRRRGRGGRGRNGAVETPGTADVQSGPERTSE